MTQLSQARSGSRLERLQKLREVFKVFDLDLSGTIESTELLQLGQARRVLGHKTSQWTDKQNENLVNKIDADGYSHSALTVFTASGILTVCYVSRPCTCCVLHVGMNGQYITIESQYITTNHQQLTAGG